MHDNIARESRLMTDEANYYIKIGARFASHHSTDHSRGEYGWTDHLTGIAVHGNTAEGFFSIFKRGMIGVYQHCSERHLHRYLAEFDFRYSNRIKLGVDDAGRAERALLSACAFGGARLEGNRVVRLVYLDEAGIGDIAKEPHIVVTAAIIDADKQWKRLRKTDSRMGLP